MGDVNSAPFFVYVPFIAFVLIFVFVLLLKLYITFSNRGSIKRVCGRSRHRRHNELENSRSQFGVTSHSTTPLPGSYPIYSCDTSVPYPYPVLGQQSMTGPESDGLSSTLFVSTVPPPVLAHCITSTSFLPPPPPYSQHDRYPPVEISNGSRTQVSRSFAKMISDIPPVE